MGRGGAENAEEWVLQAHSVEMTAKQRPECLGGASHSQISGRVLLAGRTAGAKALKEERA